MDQRIDFHKNTPTYEKEVKKPDKKHETIYLHFKDTIRRPREAEDQTERSDIFICYARTDQKYHDELKRYFLPLEKKGLLKSWSDKNITPSRKWKDDIIRTIGKVKVAILLISIDFLNSDFIRDEEIPRLLKRSEEEGVRIIPVFLKYCPHKYYNEIMQFQGINGPDRPLYDMTKPEKDKVLVDLVEKVAEILERVN
ncbi:MAG: toll/interleukin-1 receptor domain-containing protein [Alistipes sp.]|nr:toll/interleukin-1 receptor domain-containing protein [Alistipes sp.]